MQFGDGKATVRNIDNRATISAASACFDAVPTSLTNLSFERHLIFICPLGQRRIPPEKMGFHPPDARAISSMPALKAGEIHAASRVYRRDMAPKRARAGK